MFRRVFLCMLRMTPNRTLLFAALILACAGSALHAATNTWSGDGRDNLWSNPDNWTTAPPDARDNNLHLVFPVQTRLSQQTVNDIRGLTAVSLRLLGSNYELAALSSAESLTLAAGGILICLGAGNELSLPLDVENGIANLAVSNAVQLIVRGTVAGPGSLVKSGTGTLRIEGTNANTFSQLFVTGGTAIPGQARRHERVRRQSRSASRRYRASC